MGLFSKVKKAVKKFGKWTSKVAKSPVGSLIGGAIQSLIPAGSLIGKGVKLVSNGAKRIKKAKSKAGGLMGGNPQSSSVGGLEVAMSNSSAGSVARNPLDRGNSKRISSQNTSKTPLLAGGGLVVAKLLGIF